MAPFNPASPIVIAAGLVAAALVGGGGIWYVQPGHRAQVHEKVEAMHAKMVALESKLVMGALSRGERVKSKLQKLVHRFDKSKDGKIDMSDLDTNGDGHVGAVDIHTMLEHLVDEDYISDHITKETIAMFTGIHVAILGIGYFVYQLIDQGKMKKISKKGKLEITVVRASNLFDCEKSAKNTKEHSDARVRVEYADKGSKLHKAMETDTVANNLNPEFKQGKLAPITVDIDECNILKVKVVDRGTGFVHSHTDAEKPLGCFEIDIDKVYRHRNSEEIEKEFTLNGPPDTAQGTVTLKAKYVNVPMAKIVSK